MVKKSVIVRAASIIFPTIYCPVVYNYFTNQGFEFISLAAAFGGLLVAVCFFVSASNYDKTSDSI